MNPVTVKLIAIAGIIAKHLADQQAPAHDATDTCVYLDAETGNRCAVGALMSEEVASYAAGSVGVIAQYPQVVEELESYGIPMGILEPYLTAVQVYHDLASSGYSARLEAGTATYQNILQDLIDFIPEELK